LDPQRSRLENISLSSIDHLDISWKGSVSEPAKGPPILTATGRISVRINEVHVLTDVDLTLQVLRGETAQWQIAVPGLPAGTDLDVKVNPPDEQRIQSIDRAIGTEDGVVTIRLKEPSGEPLRVTLQINQRRPGGSIPVGPFSVFGALPQKGEIEVRTSDDLRLRVQPGG